jgi:hypothetical protein
MTTKPDPVEYVFDDLFHEVRCRETPVVATTECGVAIAEPVPHLDEHGNLEHLGVHVMHMMAEGE